MGSPDCSCRPNDFRNLQGELEAVVHGGVEQEVWWSKGGGGGAGGEQKFRANRRVLTTRHVHSTVELRDTASASAAGFDSQFADHNNQRRAVSGDIRVLGNLFSQKKHQFSGQEFVLVIVTRNLVSSNHCRPV